MSSRACILAVAIVVRTLSAGEISGKIVVSQQVTKPAVMISPYSRNRYTPPVIGHNSADPTSVVVYIKSHSDLKAIKSAKSIKNVDQRDISILPHVTVAQVNQKIRFTNSDRVYHNIFSLSTGNKFNLGRFPNGESREVSFSQAGTVEIFCDIHSNMNGVVVVVPNEYYSVPTANGEYLIDDLPNGTYTVAAWRESVPEQTRTVIISDENASIVLNFDL